MNADILLQKRFFNVLRIAAGPEYNYYTSHEYQNENAVLERPARIGLDSASIYGRKQYAGGKLLVEVNNLNSEIFPTRGICWHNELRVQKGLNSDTQPFTEAHTDMDIYASLSDPARLVAVLRAGAGHIFSDNYEYFQAMSIGQNNYLRGFRRNRFSGRSLAYGSLELRAKVGEIKGYVFPGAFGLVGFTDAARVWADGDPSRRWHHAVGGGAYYIPFNMFLISATTAFSREEALFNISIGTKLNVIL
jgi:outer membrane protein assembly factor BamA